MVASTSSTPPPEPANPASGLPHIAQSSAPGPQSSLSPRDTALLSALIASNFDLTKTAADHGLSSTELLHWLNTPAIQQTAATLLSTSQTFLEIKLTRARMAVIDTLQEIALYHENSTERRRAATALCRRFGYGSLLDRAGVRRPGNPPPFTDAAPPSEPKSSVLSPQVLSQSTASAQPPLQVRPTQDSRTQDPRLPLPHPRESAATPPRPYLHPTQDPDCQDILANPNWSLLAQATPTQDSGPQDPRLPLHTIPLDGDGDANHAVLPWPMPETRDPDPPSGLAQLLFHAFLKGDLPRLAATFFNYSTDDATLDNRPLKEALPHHILAVMYRSREVAFVERTRGPNEATYTFSFERAPLSPSRASFRFLFTRTHSDTWHIHQIDTLDTS